MGCASVQLFGEVTDVLCNCCSKECEELFLSCLKEVNLEKRAATRVCSSEPIWFLVVGQ